MSDDNKNIDDIIKGGFDDTNDDFNLDSWDDLANRLDQNDDLDGSIASAFNTAEEEVPSSVWSNVNDDLDIDTVWSRINTALTKRKRRALIWWNAASIAFVILIIGGLITRQSIEQLYTAESVNIEQQKLELDNSTIDFNPDKLTTSSIETKTGELNTSEVNTFITEAAKSEPSRVDNDIYKREKFISQKQPSKKDQNLSTPLKDQIDHDRDILISSLEPLMLRFNYHLIPTKLNSNNNFNELTNNRTKDDPTRKWLIGLKGSAVNCEIIDGLSSQANSENSLVSSNFTVTFNPALFAQYKLKNGYFLQTDFYWNYKVRRSVNQYDQLEYVSKTTELDYLRINFNAGKSFQLSKLTDKINLNVTLGGYWDYLKSQREYRGRTLISKEKSYDSNNYGLSSEIAIQHNFKRISIAYGTELDLGLHNINLTSASAFSGFNAARTLSYGLFFRLGYSF